MRTNKFIFILAIFVCLVFIFSCKNEEEKTPNGNVSVKFETQTDEIIPLRKVPVGTEMSLPIPKEREGYVFDGWTLNGEIYHSFNTIINNITLVAKWKPIEYTITYIRAEGVVKTYTIEDEIDLPCVYQEYTEFYGWSKNYYGGVKYDKIEKGTTGNIILYAEIKTHPFIFKEKSDGTYEVSGVDLSQIAENKRNELTIPKQHNGKPVTSIGEKAFEGVNCKKVTVQSNIKDIGNYAFLNCNLEEVVIDYGVKYIGKNAFEKCKNLTKVYISTSVSKIDDYAFSTCDKIVKIQLSNNIELGKDAFHSSTQIIYINVAA